MSAFVLTLNGALFLLLLANKIATEPYFNDLYYKALLQLNEEKLNLNSYFVKKKVSDVAGYDLTNEEMKKFKIWPNGLVPYYIDIKSYKDKILRDKIRSVLNLVNSITSLSFVELPAPPADDSTRWVFFVNRRGQLECADHSIRNFTNEGVQQVVLGYDCMNTEGELPEAVLAIAGVPPQHNAPDRDSYITVNMENIKPDKTYLFDKLNDDEWLFHDLDYDLESVGHYHNFKYSANGRAVIEPKFADVTVGESKLFSDTDILKIRMLYNFISKKRQLGGEECGKLFKVGPKLNKFVPTKSIIKPKRKPNRYLGLPEDQQPEGDYDSEEQQQLDNDEKHDTNGDGDKSDNSNEEQEDNFELNDENASDTNDNMKEKNEKILQNAENDKSESNMEDDYELDNAKELNNEKNNLKESYKSNATETNAEENLGEESQETLKKIKIYRPKKFKSNTLGHLSDYGSLEFHQLKSYKKTSLEGMSDYDSTQEKNRKERIDKVKNKTLKYSTSL